jgi:hypothetical protein
MTHVHNDQDLTLRTLCTNGATFAPVNGDMSQWRSRDGLNQSRSSQSPGTGNH